MPDMYHKLREVLALCTLISLHAASVSSWTFTLPYDENGSSGNFAPVGTCDCAERHETVQQLLTQLAIAHNRYDDIKEENLRLKYHTPIVLGLPGPETVWWQLVSLVLGVACCSVAAWAYDRDQKAKAKCEQLQRLLAQKETYWRQKLRTFSESAEQLSKLIQAKAFGQKGADGQVGYIPD